MNIKAKIIPDMSERTIEITLDDLGLSLEQFEKLSREEIDDKIQEYIDGMKEQPWWVLEQWIFV